MFKCGNTSLLEIYNSNCLIPTLKCDYIIFSALSLRSLAPPTIALKIRAVNNDYITILNNPVHFM